MGIWEEENLMKNLRALQRTAVIVTVLVCFLFIADSNLQAFICGDVNMDEVVDISDVTYLVEYLFLGGPAPDLAATDCDGDSETTISDLTCFIEYFFHYGPLPSCGELVHQDMASGCLRSSETFVDDNQNKTLQSVKSLSDGAEEYMYARIIGEELRVYHMNGYFDCCIWYHVDYTVQSQPDGIYVTAIESNLNAPCDSMCYGDLESSYPIGLYIEPITFYVTLIGIDGEIVGTDTVTLEPNGYMYCEVIGNDLVIHHDNTLINCCPAYYVAYEIGGPNIYAIEGDSLPQCYCLCYFNLQSTLYNLDQGEYYVTLIAGENMYYPGDTVGVDTVVIGF
jgi:hypothetical protein